MATRGRVTRQAGPAVVHERAHFILVLAQSDLKTRRFRVADDAVRQKEPGARKKRVPLVQLRGEVHEPEDGEAEKKERGRTHFRATAMSPFKVSFVRERDCSSTSSLSFSLLLSFFLSLSLSLSIFLSFFLLSFFLFFLSSLAASTYFYFFSLFLPPLQREGVSWKKKDW